VDHERQQAAPLAPSLPALINRARTRHPGDDEAAAVYLAELVTAQSGDTAGELCRLAATLTAAAGMLPAATRRSHTRDLPC
jgi:hypothetical protein